MKRTSDLMYEIRRKYKLRERVGNDVWGISGNWEKRWEKEVLIYGWYNKGLTGLIPEREIYLDRESVGFT